MQPASPPNQFTANWKNLNPTGELKQNFEAKKFQNWRLITEALLGMLAPGAGIRGVTLFWSKNR